MSSVRSEVGSTKKLLGHLCSLPTPSSSTKPDTQPVILERVFLDLTHTAELPLALPMKVSYHKLLPFFPRISLLLVCFPWHGLSAERRQTPDMWLLRWHCQKRISGRSRRADAAQQGCVDCLHRALCAQSSAKCLSSG